MSAERCCMIIDARPLVRLGIRRELGSSWDFEELGNGLGAVETLTSVGNIEVAIVEIRAAERGAPSGTATIRDLLHHQPGLGVIAHGGRIERHAVGEAFDAGASPSARPGSRSPQTASATTFIRPRNPTLRSSSPDSRSRSDT